MPRAASKNNVIAGVFLIVALALAIFMSVVISGAARLLTPTKPYVVVFTLAEGAAGIQPGSPVMLGGQSVGRVTGVMIAKDASSQPDSIRVDVRVRSDLALYEDAWVFLERPLLGSLGSINITDPGSGKDAINPQGAGPVLEPGEAVRGRIAPPSFLAQAGYGPEQAQQVRTIISKAESLIDRVDAMASAVQTDLSTDLEMVRGSLEDIRAITDRTAEKMPGWTDTVDRTLANSESASAKLPGLVDNADARVTEARGVIASVQGAIDDNRPKFDRIASEVEETTTRVNDETLPRLNDSLDRAREGVDSFTRVAERVDAMLAEEAPTIRRVLANFRLASDQLKLTLVEVRQSPWRLLYRPKTKELESQLFYDAARAYAEAASDLRAASESLEAAAADPSRLALERESLDGLMARLSEAFARYQDAERTLLEKIARETPK